MSKSITSRSFAPTDVSKPAEPAHPSDADPQLTVPLIVLAWARSGDKGDLFNVGVFAREPRFFPYIAAALSSEVVGEWFAHFVADPAHPKVDRYVMPGPNGLNFVVHDSLGGGGSMCARMDPIAKTMGQNLLEYPVPVSPAIMAELATRDKSLPAYA